MSSIHENCCEKLAQDTRKVNENGEKGQDKVKESKNNNPVENVAVAAAVGELAPGREHRGSSCPIVSKEDTPVPSYIDNLPSETDNKDDGLLKTNTETIDGDKNSQLDPEKGLIIPIVESLLEESKESGQVSLDLSKVDGDSAKVGKDNPVDEDKMAIVPNNESVEDNVGGPMKEDREILIEQDIASVEPDNKPLGDHNKCVADSGVETLKVNEHRTADAESINHADNEKGPVQPCTETDFVKGPTTSDCETQSKHGNETSKPVTVTSTNLEKGADMPATDASTDNDKRPDALAAGASRDHGRGLADTRTAQTSSYHEKGVSELEAEAVEDMKDEVPDSKVVPVNGEPAADSEKRDNFETPPRIDADTENASKKHDDSEPGTAYVTASNIKSEEERSGALNNGVHETDSTPPTTDGMMSSKHSFLLDDMSEGNESGKEEEQSAFMKELENFFRERNMEFRPPKFYGEGLNCLKLWRAVTRLGGYDKVTTCKLWRQVGESFRPPKTCTTVSWTFRGFYEKALLEYERHKVSGGELYIPLASHSEPNVDNQASGSGRARRDAAARAMQGWHSQRLLGNGEVSDPIIKDKSSVPQQKREKQIVTPGLLKRKKLPSTEQAAKIARTQVSKPLLDVTVVDLGPPADWVKINVQRTKDCFEVYALVPGLLREEVRVQSDPAGRLVISGEPENPDNLWGATPFKKVVSLPTRIDPHHTSAVVTLNGQLFVRVPLEESD